MASEAWEILTVSMIVYLSKRIELVNFGDGRDDPAADDHSNSYTPNECGELNHEGHITSVYELV
jgi:hypothetical protein